MNAENKTTMKIAFDKAKFENDVLIFYRNCYREHGGDKNKFKGRMIKLLEIACQTVDFDEVSVGQRSDANGHSPDVHRSPIEQDHAIDAERPRRGCPAQPHTAGLNVCSNEGQIASASRTPNDQGQSRAAERPLSPCPDQTHSMGQAKDAESRRCSAHRTPSNGLGQKQAVNEGLKKTAQPVRPTEPTKSQINASLIAKQTLAKSLFDTIWLGKPVGAWSYRSLVAIENDGNFAKALREEIGDVAEADKDREVIDLLGKSEARLRKVMMDCNRIKPKKAA